jgi:hypothetical protein
LDTSAPLKRLSCFDPGWCKANRKGGTLAHFAADRKFCAMALSDVFHNRQAQAGSPGITRAAAIDAVKTLG